MRRRLVTGVAGVVALVLAVPMALVGRAALGIPDAVAQEQAVAAGAQVGRHPRSLADRAARSLVAADRAGPFTRIVETYRTVAELPALSGQPTWSVQIARLIPRVRSPADRSQAYVMAGTVLALGAGDGLGVPLNAEPEGARTLLAQALDDFRAAVRADDTNADAKFDLELLLRQTAPARRQVEPDATRRDPPPRQRPVGKRRQVQPRIESRINDAGLYASGSGY